MRSELGFGIALGATLIAGLVPLGVITNLWAFALGLWIGWALMELLTRWADGA